MNDYGALGGGMMMIMAIVLIVLAILGFLMPYFVYKISCDMSEIKRLMNFYINKIEKESQANQPAVVETKPGFICSNCDMDFDAEKAAENNYKCPACDGIINPQ